jgi:uncharacterized coiled-coil protein SlyX
VSATRSVGTPQGPPRRALLARSWGRRVHCWLACAGFGAVLAACPFQTTPVTPEAAADSAAGGTPAPAPAPAPSTAARDPALEQRVARLDLRLAEREAQVEDLRARLDEARQEVVRALAKLQTVASRAEAASAMAEAEIAVQALRAATGAQPGGGGGGGGGGGSDAAQAGTLLAQASAEFAKQNYGGALYLANQAKSLAGAGRNRLSGAGRAPLRPGEVPFAVPVRLQATARSKVRDGPGAGYKVLFTVEPGTGLVGYSYLDPWVRVADESGRAGWMFLNLVGRRGAEPVGR